jgi:hypothetical protein
MKKSKGKLIVISFLIVLLVAAFGIAAKLDMRPDSAVISKPAEASIL